MGTFEPEQALARFRELMEQQDADFDQLSGDVQLRIWCRECEWISTVHYQLQELKQEAERNGFFLVRGCFDELHCEYHCNALSPDGGSWCLAVTRKEKRPNRMALSERFKAAEHNGWRMVDEEEQAAWEWARAYCDKKRAYNKAYYEQHKKQILAQQKIYRAKKKQELAYTDV